MCVADQLSVTPRSWSAPLFSHTLQILCFRSLRNLFIQLQRLLYRHMRDPRRPIEMQ